EATYTNLGPGRYRFHVIAANNDGLWNETGAALGFVVLPAFYQTWWFYAACIVAGAALLALLYRLRLRPVAAAVRLRLAERIGERERIARDLHDTLLQSLQGLLLRLQIVHDSLPERETAREMMARAMDQTDQVLIEGRDRVRELRSVDEATVPLPEALRNA